MYVVCIFFTVQKLLVNASLTSQHFHEKTKIWNLRLGNVIERGLVDLTKQCLVGSEILRN